MSNLPVGRHVWLPDPDRLEKIKQCGKLGLNVRLTCRAIGISEGTWFEKIKDYPEILKAREEGQMEGALEVSKCLYQNAIEPATDKFGNIVGPPGGNVSAQTAYLAQVADWKKKQEVSGPEGGPVQVHIMLPDNGHQGDDKPEAD